MPPSGFQKPMSRTRHRPMKGPAGTRPPPISRRPARSTRRFVGASLGTLECRVSAPPCRRNALLWNDPVTYCSPWVAVGGSYDDGSVCYSRIAPEGAGMVMIHRELPPPITFHGLTSTELHPRSDSRCGPFSSHDDPLNAHQAAISSRQRRPAATLTLLLAPASGRRNMTSTSCGGSLTPCSVALLWHALEAQGPESRPPRSAIVR